MVSTTMRTIEWQIMKSTVRGVTHVRLNLENQDAIASFPDGGVGETVILAVSDGHGSSNSFRSDKGSQFAVNIAIETLKEFLESQSEITHLTKIKRLAEEKLPRQLVRRWEDAVDKDIVDNKNYFSIEELTRLSGKNDASDEDFVDIRLGEKRFIPYGATLLTVVITPTFIMYLQLGDGDILTVGLHGEVERPLPKDDRLFGNETTSLCTKEAWRDVRFRFQPIVETPPHLILVATDGYANSFRDDAGFLKVGSDFLAIIQSNGFNYAQEHIEEWLYEASQAGSGDDITVGILCQKDITINYTSTIEMPEEDEQNEKTSFLSEDTVIVDKKGDSDEILPSIHNENAQETSLKTK